MKIKKAIKIIEHYYKWYDDDVVSGDLKYQVIEISEALKTVVKHLKKKENDKSNGLKRP